MALVSVIRRWHLREQVSIRAIARRTGLSRNTVRKYLANGVVEPRYPKRNSRSNLDHFAEKLAGWLKAESSRGRKQRLSVKELYVRLRQLGYCGSYDRVSAFARRWRRARPTSSMWSRPLRKPRSRSARWSRYATRSCKPMKR